MPQGSRRRPWKAEKPTQRVIGQFLLRDIEVEEDEGRISFTEQELRTFASGKRNVETVKKAEGILWATHKKSELSWRMPAKKQPPKGRAAAMGASRQAIDMPRTMWKRLRSSSVRTVSERNRPSAGARILCGFIRQS